MSGQISGREGNILLNYVKVLLIPVVSIISLIKLLYRKLLDNFEEIKRQFSEVSENFCTYSMCLYHTVDCMRMFVIHTLKSAVNTAIMNHYMLLLCMITGIPMGWPCMEKATTILLISFVYSLCVKWLHAANTCSTHFSECCSMCTLMSMSI